MHRVTFILPCALFTPLLDSLLSQYTVVHLLHVRRTLRPRTPQPLEREARGQPWGKSSSTTNGNKKNLHDQKHTSKKTFCCFLPYSLSVLSSPCHRYKFCVFARKGGYSLSRDHKHISHRAERALQNRSHCPQMFISLHLYTSLSFKFSSPGDEGCWVFNLLLTVSHTNLGFNIWTHFLPFFFF